MKLKGISTERMHHLFGKQKDNNTHSHLRSTSGKQFLSLASTSRKSHSSTGIRLERKNRISMDTLYKDEAFQQSGQ